MTLAKWQAVALILTVYTDERQKKTHDEEHRAEKQHSRTLTLRAAPPEGSFRKATLREERSGGYGPGDTG
jgi:hypothetical protein